jgi:hypothetical protein
MVRGKGVTTKGQDTLGSGLTARGACGTPPGVEQDSSATDEREHTWRRLEKALPELIRRAVELGYDKLTEGPENVRSFVNDLRLPKEVLQAILSQMEDTKSGITRSVAREVRDFLDRSDVADALVRALTRVSLEIRTEVRFVPQDTGAKPDVRSTVRVHESRNAVGTPSEQPAAAPEEEP